MYEVIQTLTLTGYNFVQKCPQFLRRSNNETLNVQQSTDEQASIVIQDQRSKTIKHNHDSQWPSEDKLDSRISTKCCQNSCRQYADKFRQ